MGGEDLARLRAVAGECRRLATECREVAKSISLRPDREILLDMARRHDEQAANLETRIAAAAAEARLAELNAG